MVGAVKRSTFVAQLHFLNDVVVQKPKANKKGKAIPVTDRRGT
jgi:hypothetical protein